MPDPIDISARRRKEEFEKHRAGRIYQLSKEWGVPTNKIFSQSKWGYNPSAIPDYITYYALQGDSISHQKIDYAPVKGYPEGVYLPKTNYKPLTDSTTLNKIINPVPIPKAALGAVVQPYEEEDQLEKSKKLIHSFFKSQTGSGVIPATAKLYDGPEPTPLMDTNQFNARPEKRSSFGIPEMSLNTAPLITGLNAAINKLYEDQRINTEYTRLKRKNLQTPAYNQHQNGTGSQGLFYNGGKVAPIKLPGNNQSEMIVFSGPTHKEGGIPISYEGQLLEVEGGEPAFISKDGSLNIFGNLPVPGMPTKFKNIAQKIGKFEVAALKKLNTAYDSMLSAGSNDLSGKLKYNTGQLHAKTAQKELDHISTLKDRLASLQETALKNMNPNGPQPYTAQDGRKVRKPSMAERNNNPGNIKFAPWLQKSFGATKGEKAKDGGNFAVFKDKETGLKAIKTLLKGPAYKNLNVQDALKKWTNTEGYKIDLQDLRDQRVGSLPDSSIKKLINIITQGEDSKLYDLSSLDTVRPVDPQIDISINAGKIPNIPPFYGNNPPNTPILTNKKNGDTTGFPDLNTPPNQKKPAIKNRLHFSQIAPDLLAFMDREEFIPGNRYEPYLYQPYQVSFQDRLNENQATFNRIASQSGSNPEALSLLGAQKYSADMGVLGDEFRTNQGISNNVINKNVSILNDAKLRNLELADTQLVRQAQAHANTKRNQYDAISSISGKIDQNTLESRIYNALASMYPNYEFESDGSRYFIPGDQEFTSSSNPSGSDFYTRKRSEYDGKGQIKKMTETKPSPAEQEKLEYILFNNQLKRKQAFKKSFR